jgi:hypothetical protein
MFCHLGLRSKEREATWLDRLRCFNLLSLMESKAFRVGAKALSFSGQRDFKSLAWRAADSACSSKYAAARSRREWFASFRTSAPFQIMR